MIMMKLPDASLFTGYGLAWSTVSESVLMLLLIVKLVFGLSWEYYEELTHNGSPQRL